MHVHKTQYHNPHLHTFTLFVQSYHEDGSWWGCDLNPQYPTIMSDFYRDKHAPKPQERPRVAKVGVSASNYCFNELDVYLHLGHIYGVNLDKYPTHGTYGGFLNWGYPHWTTIETTMVTTGDPPLRTPPFFGMGVFIPGLYGQGIVLQDFFQQKGPRRSI